MFTVFDPLCNGLRDPRNVSGEVRLSWRVGSDRAGARQTTYRVVVVSLVSGDVAWDSGEVRSRDCSVRYGGAPQESGTYCSWFVTVTDDDGCEAISAPAAFCWGSAGDAAYSELGDMCQGLVWTSSDSLNASLEQRGSLRPDDDIWRNLLGIERADGDPDVLRIAPDVSQGLTFVQGSLLVERGLLVVRWECADAGVRLEVSLPPGMEGELVLPRNRARVSSGRHAIEG